MTKDDLRLVGQVKLAKSSKTKNGTIASWGSSTATKYLGENLSYCRRCQQVKSVAHFSKATNTYIDTNGFLSICNQCASDIINDYLKAYKNDYKKAMYAFCMQLDIKYDEDIAERVENDKKIYPNRSIPTMYINNIVKSYNGDSITFNEKALNVLKDDEVPENLVEKWGEWSASEYKFLEAKYKEYIDEFGAYSASEKDNFITLCILILRSRNDPSNKDVTTALQNQYKTLGITPEQMRKANADKDKMIIGMEASIIERTRPAEVYQDEKLYFDHDGLRRDMYDIKRAIKNHLAGTKDFESLGVDLSEVYNGSDDD